MLEAMRALHNLLSLRRRLFYSAGTVRFQIPHQPVQCFPVRIMIFPIAEIWNEVLPDFSR